MPIELASGNLHNGIEQTNKLSSVHSFIIDRESTRSISNPTDIMHYCSVCFTSEDVRQD